LPVNSKTDMNIVTKFTIASHEGIETLSMLTRELAREKFSALLETPVIDTYIDQYFNRKTLVDEINSMSNEWLTVYVNDHPAGYAKITSKGKAPLLLEHKRVVRIAEFGILKKYPEHEVRNALFEKCLSVCKRREGIWVNEYPESPVIDFFESKGFLKQPESCQLEELPLASVCLVYINDATKK